MTSKTTQKEIINHLKSLDKSLSSININHDILANSNEMLDIKINSQLIKTIIQLLKITFDIRK